MKRIIFAITAIVILAMTFSSCGISHKENTDPSVTSLRYNGGAFSGSKFKECVPAGTRLATNDKLYPYPNTQRQDLFSDTTKGADHPDIQVTDNSGVAMNMQVNVQFFLNTSCTPVTVDGKKYPGGTLQVFHEKIGKTRHAYFNNDGTYGDGWIQAMDYYITQPVEQLINTATKQYTAQQLWLNQQVNSTNGAVVTPDANGVVPDGTEGVQQYLADTITAALPKAVNDNMETDLQFYNNFKVNVISITPSQDYLDLFKKRQQAQVEAQTAQDNAAAQVAQAEAQQKVEKANAATLQQIISGYGSVQAYLEHEAIENGINPFQPTGTLVGQAK